MATGPGPPAHWKHIGREADLATARDAIDKPGATLAILGPESDTMIVARHLADHARSKGWRVIAAGSLAEARRIARGQHATPLQPLATDVPTGLDTAKEGVLGSDGRRDPALIIIWAPSLSRADLPAKLDHIREAGGPCSVVLVGPEPVAAPSIEYPIIRLAPLGADALHTGLTMVGGQISPPATESEIAHWVEALLEEPQLLSPLLQTLALLVPSTEALT